MIIWNSHAVYLVEMKKECNTKNDLPLDTSIDFYQGWRRQRNRPRYAEWKSTRTIDKQRKNTGYGVFVNFI